VTRVGPTVSELGRSVTGNYRSIDFVIHPPPSVDEVLTLLQAVIDPELGADIVTLGMVPGVSVTAEGAVSVGVKLTIGGCPLRAQIKKDVESRVAVHPGVTSVKIDWGEMNSDERTDVMLKARWNARESAAPTAVPVTTRVLAIASGKGGVGKSSVTVNLAAAVAAQGFTVGVLDADIWGFSVPRLLGIDEPLEAQKVEGSDKPKIIPNELVVGRGLSKGLLKVVRTGAAGARRAPAPRLHRSCGCAAAGRSRGPPVPR